LVSVGWGYSRDSHPVSDTRKQDRPVQSSLHSPTAARKRCVPSSFSLAAFVLPASMGGQITAYAPFSSKDGPAMWSKQTSAERIGRMSTLAGVLATNWSGAHCCAPRSRYRWAPVSKASRRTTQAKSISKETLTILLSGEHPAGVRSQLHLRNSHAANPRAFCDEPQRCAWPPHGQREVCCHIGPGAIAMGIASGCVRLSRDALPFAGLVRPSGTAWSHERNATTSASGPILLGLL
jgi:hypothetical protein